jgi:hypothetical protein
MTFTLFLGSILISVTEPRHFYAALTDSFLLAYTVLYSAKFNLFKNIDSASAPAREIMQLRSRPRYRNNELDNKTKLSPVFSIFMIL